ncbi:MAG: 16S rRNA (adenine(1518)-N(6)/adenine(1519)-N(6))-dimethyltransferase RsmA [Armatimonadota bacterium]|nr:MAG: 16S rRNA (adenine(1518)-N(6)/adenine(1519)-N(6))-dimethyltransferase RsmA [Armatimonadota bacterium]
MTSPTELRRLLAKYDVRPSKRLGQSFLIDGNIVAKTLAAAAVGAEDRVFEVGPGAGALTAALADAAGEVVALELDRRLVELLDATIGAAPNVRIAQGDILKVDVRDLLGGGTWKLLANLPYSIVGPTVAKLVAHRKMFPLMVLMVQREVAERLTARPGTRQYGTLSVLAQAHMTVGAAAQVGRGCFYPQPEVDSTLVRLNVREDPVVEKGLEDTFTTVVRAVFRQRRKTLLNALTAAEELGLTREDGGRVIAEAGIDSGLRPGVLSPAEFAALARVLRDSAAQ